MKDGTLTEMYDAFLTAFEAQEEKAVNAYFEIIKGAEPHKERDPHRLFISDVGSCPRAVAYRLLQAEKRPMTRAAQANKHIMFDLAGHMEAVLTAAAMWANRLADAQFFVPMDDRVNWGGRGDLEVEFDDEIHIVEVKTTRSNALQRDSRTNQAEPIFVTHLTPDGLPYLHHVYQTTLYEHYMCEGTEPIIWQADRGGANTPREFHLSLPLTEEMIGHGIELMDELDDVRANLPNLPDVLPKVLKYTDKKRGQDFCTKIKEVPDYRCSMCDYRKDILGGSCEPLQGTTTWATSTDGLKWEYTPAAKADVLDEFASERAVVGF